MKQQLSDILSWLSKPFPFSETWRSKVVISVIFGLFVFSFLAFFQPFGITKIVADKNLFLLGFGVITFVIMIISFFILPLILPAFFELENWVVGKHILFCLWNILIISLMNWLYNSYQLKQAIAKPIDLPTFLVITAAVGLIPTVILTLLAERELWKKNNDIAQSVSSQLLDQKEKSESTESIELVSDSSRERLTLLLSNLIYIHSEGNYARVCYWTEGKLKEKLLRTPLKKVEEQLEKHEMIVRCHRSYVVNINQISEIRGNARSLKLHFADTDSSIPVSRSFPKSIIDQIRSR